MKLFLTETHRRTTTPRSTRQRLSRLATVAAHAPRTRRLTGRVTDADGQHSAEVSFSSSI
ncbi:hypothetical protein IQ62_40910 [Streptomyces scabiei]|nr:hypothetical protein IQ62_40910 [Streptomyces scabiei]